MHSGIEKTTTTYQLLTDLAPIDYVQLRCRWMLDLAPIKNVQFLNAKDLAKFNALLETASNRVAMVCNFTNSSGLEILTFHVFFFLFVFFSSSTAKAILCYGPMVVSQWW